MSKQQVIKFFEPLQALTYIEQNYKHYTLLYSATRSEYSGNKSFLAFGLKNEYNPESFDFIDQLEKKKCMLFGYFGYEMKYDVEKKYNKTEESYVQLPVSRLCEYNNLIVFDHSKKTIKFFGEDQSFVDHLQEIENIEVEAVKVESNVDAQQYLANVEYVKDLIRQGELYQANVNRKYFGKLNKVNAISIFKKLVEENPTLYSALIKHNKQYIISNSPEQFMKLNELGFAETRPIKGTIKRDLTDKENDEKIRISLQESIKNRSENLMIVDLMRNDLNRNAVPGSVMVPELFKTSTHHYIHHLFSTITAKKRRNVTPVKLLKDSFPPGSMTGAPKVSVVNYSEQIEKINRGVYSGIIGWIRPEICFDFSVVIRTIIIDEDRFEFQVGGAIVIDSDPADELEECLNKAYNIAKVLNIEIEHLRK